MKIPFLDLKKPYFELKKEIDTAVEGVLKGGWYVLGENVRLFEKEFAAYCGCRYCVGVGSGMDALELLLKAYDVGPGTEVIVPANTYIATALAVSNVGAAPVLVEPDPKTCNINPLEAGAAISPQTKAVMAVHLYGQTADMTGIRKTCHKYGLKLLEDAAQAHGAMHFGARAGSLGDGAGFSFYPGKNLGAFGDGGAVLTDERDVAEYVRMARNYGSEQKYHNAMKGMNSRLDELQAAILRVKLRHLDEWNRRRTLVAEIYLDRLEALDEELVLPHMEKGNTHVWHLFTIRSARRDELRAHLEKEGIGTLIHYPIPLYSQAAYKEMNNLRENYPVSNSISEQILSLPMGPHLSNKEVKYVCEEINRFFQR